ncbi:protein phosphatase [Nakamurella panacisegetis]|uniref:Protein phosphatase n=1 Tax=Nakamurella panacisegetis TaxID=1090615 RepID=A0A1H0KPV1_9ACTN|nr:PP2C family serine/threonine-protein phosphatase [Nakamurella panacisegetis]SDO57790.1 protein phosphatase [Nakamurella panacisegetis]
MSHVIRYAARTDRGLLRANNQDSVFAGDRLLVIADGMGGHAAGDVASRLVVAAFVDLDELPLGSDMVRPLTEATREGNAAIAEMVEENPEFDGMGTTLTALLFDGPVVALAHVGDSRAYLYRNGVLHQISHDDTFVQSLVDDGRITADEAAHHPQRSLLLRALNGMEMDPSITLRETSPGDRFLICSDGLSDVVSPESIADTLAGPDVDQVADTLIQLALVGGGPDNVTVIVADVLETGATGSPGVAAGAVDPEATGPMQPIHLTQRMPRVPLPPIPEDIPAKPEYAPAEEGPELHNGDDEEYDDEDDFSAASDIDAHDDPDDHGMVSPPRRHWRRRWAFGIALLVLIGAGLTGSVLWANSKYYVGQDGREVAVFRGVNGSLLGWKFASVQENSCGTTPSGCRPLMVTDLVQAARDQVSAGIPVSTLADARAVITRLTSEQLPPCPTTGTGSTLSSLTPASSGAASSSVAASSAPTTPTSSVVVPPTTAAKTTAAKTTAKVTPPRTTAKSTAKATARTAARTTSKASGAAKPTTTPRAVKATTTALKAIAPVTTTVVVTVNPLAPSAAAVTDGQHLRSRGVLPTPASALGTAPITRSNPAGVTPTITVFTTTTLLPTAATPSAQPGTPLVSPAAEPGVTCRPVS